ncbi:MAG: hypothetical protein ACXWWQ_03185 [Candidatus Limnocylindria bacterium]
MSVLLAGLRWLITRLSVVLALATVLGRARDAWRRRGEDASQRRRDERDVLPSLFDRYPDAIRAPRRRLGLRGTPLERIVGTMRHPSQNTADFLPLPKLRGQNWRARWQRINRAVDGLKVLPPVDLVQVGDDYWVEDGHNRVAAARLAGAGEVDADITQLLLPGVTRGQGTVEASTLVDSDVVRQAGRGRYSRTVEQHTTTDSLSREDLLREPDEAS